MIGQRVTWWPCGHITEVAETFELGDLARCEACGKEIGEKKTYAQPLVRAVKITECEIPDRPGRREVNWDQEIDRDRQKL